MEKDQMVIYKDVARFLACGCGLVEELDQCNPEYVWVRWVGECEKTRAHISNLIEI